MNSDPLSMSTLMTPVSRPIAAKAFLQADKAAMIGDGDVARLRGSWITTRVLYQVATPGSTLPPGTQKLFITIVPPFACEALPICSGLDCSFPNHQQSRRKETVRD